MSHKMYLKTFLLVALVCIGLGGFLLHFGIHPIIGERAKIVNFVPFIAGLMTIFIVTSLFILKGLMPFAYLLNGMIVIIGTVTMTAFSITPHHFPLWPDILVLFTVFCIGKLLFETEMITEANIGKPRHKGRFFRYPNMGYWFVHLVTLSVVFSLGHILWI